MKRKGFVLRVFLLGFLFTLINSEVLSEAEKEPQAEIVKQQNVININRENRSVVKESDATVKRALIPDVFEGVLEEYEILDTQVAIAYYNFQTGDCFYQNENEVMDAASTTKVAIAALFVNLIEQGNLQWETELPYAESCYEDGDGRITNSEKRASYAVEEVMYEMLVHSDNTATNILANYYMNHYAYSFTGYREDIVALSGGGGSQSL